MTVRAELDLASYDRLFPAQDFMPKGSFGNLIALPLQRECRRRGATVFLDRRARAVQGPVGVPVLASVAARRRSRVRRRTASRGRGRPDGAHLSRPSAPATRSPRHRSGRWPARCSRSTASGSRRPSSPSFKHLASLHNPEYYEKERLRFSTWNTPRLIRCYERDRRPAPAAEGPPRGGGRHRGGGGQPPGGPGQPRRPRRRSTSNCTPRCDPDQQAALGALSHHDLGVLVAPPGAGKTVVGLRRHRASRDCHAVLVDRQPLLEQWRERLQDHLGLGRRQIGTLRAGRSRPKGIVDVAMVQSLARRDDLARAHVRRMGW